MFCIVQINCITKQNLRSHTQKVTYVIEIQNPGASIAAE
uniref:Uncharacterized protein n=1 Tax=Rhizophora mucronata TaxID=61149 RepID=A0A2P2N9N6_RHIMU